MEGELAFPEGQADPEASVSARTTTRESRQEARREFEDETVAAERAFAIRVAYDGIPAAFLAVLAEDSIISGAGPEPGRSAYRALPKDHPGRLLWEPTVVAASADGTLACTAGPYRLLDPGGQDPCTGVYLSVWRRNAGSGQLELVLDFGSKGAVLPESAAGLQRLQVPEPVGGAGAMVRSLQQWVEETQCPSAEGALWLGDSSGGPSRPSGFQQAQDGGLGVLWGARSRPDGSPGGFAIVFGPGDPQPVPLVCIHA
jgi:hypothetical protein